MFRKPRRSDFTEQAEDELRVIWKKEHPRMAEILRRAEEEHDHLVAVIDAMTNAREAYVHEYLEEQITEIVEAAEEASDPYGSRGLSRSMFV